MNATLPKLTSFVLPGGSRGARTRTWHACGATRRARCGAAGGRETVTPALLRYLNRLSDHLFVLARLLNGNGAEEVLVGARRGAAVAPISAGRPA